MNAQTAGMPASPPSYRAASRYEDVWAREEAICAFCATAVEPTQARCPGCDRQLQQRRFQYERPSSNYVVLWVLMGAGGCLYLILVLGDLVQRSGLPVAAVHVFLGLIFLLLGAGIYLRQFWAWATTIPVLMITLFLSIVQVIAVDTTINVPERLEQMTRPALDNAFAQALISVLYTLLVLTQGGALLWAVFFAGPDFSREQTQLVARLERGLVNAADYYTAGRRYAKQEMWATAVLHWQRAAALAPYSWRYLLALAEGYAQLGFFERNADVLQSAAKLAPGDAAVDVERVRQLARQREAGVRK